MTTQAGFCISAHAILRYMERVMGINVILAKQATQSNDTRLVRQIARWRGINLEDLSQHILPDEVCRAAAIFGDGNYPARTHTVRIRDRSVVTVVV